MAEKIVAQLPIVSRADLVFGDRCEICHEAYSTNRPNGEDPVRLPCGHEFGFECIRRWLSPEEGKNTCPLCRYQLFAPPAREFEDTRAAWDSIVTAVDFDIELTTSGLMQGSSRFRDWALYSQLQEWGANLPPWQHDGVFVSLQLDSSQENALFMELQRRGAFRVLPIDVGPLDSEQQIRAAWDTLRYHRYSYDPYCTATDGSAWFQY